MALTKVTYSMIKGEYANVLDYGADPTGVSDSTIAFQAAITVGSIYIPDGTYLVSSVLVSQAGRTVIGESKKAIIKRKDLTYKPVFVVSTDNFTATGFTIDGNRNGNPLSGFTPTGGGSPIALEDQGDIACRNSSSAFIFDVAFINSFTSPTDFYNMKYSTVAYCSSINHAREGFMIISGQYCSINNCYSQGGTIQPYSLIGTMGLPTDTQDHNHIVADNLCFDSQAAFVTINTSHTQVSGNTIGKTLGLASTGPGIRLGHDIPGQSTAYGRVYNNHVFGIADVGSGGTGRGISLENADFVEIFDNSVYDCRTGIGASVTPNASFVITNNLIDSSVLLGMDLFSVTTAQIESNIIRNCPTGINVSGTNCLFSNNYVINATTAGYKATAASGGNSGHVFQGNRTDSTTTNKWDIASPAGHTYVDNEYGTNNFTSTTISGATPSVIAGNLFLVNNATATDMTALANWKEGAIYTLLFANSNTTLKQSGSFRMKGSVDTTPSAAKIIQFLASGSLFYEVSRSY